MFIGLFLSELSDFFVALPFFSLLWEKIHIPDFFVILVNPFQDLLTRPLLKLINLLDVFSLFSDCDYLPEV